MVTEVNHFTIVVLLYDHVPLSEAVWEERCRGQLGACGLKLGHIAMYITELLIFGRAKKKFTVLKFQGYK